MPEQSPNQAGSEDSSEQFVDLEVQEHFEAISKDLPLYEQYYKELEEMAKSLGTRLTDQQMPPAHERRVSLEANKATIDSEMLAICIGSLHTVHIRQLLLTDNTHRASVAQGRHEV